MNAGPLTIHTTRPAPKAHVQRSPLPTVRGSGPRPPELAAGPPLRRAPRAGVGDCVRDSASASEVAGDDRGDGSGIGGGVLNRAEVEECGLPLGGPRLPPPAERLRGGVLKALLVRWWGV